MAELRLQPARYFEVSLHPATALRGHPCRHLRPAEGFVVPLTTHRDPGGRRHVSSRCLSCTYFQVSGRPEVSALYSRTCDPHQLRIEIWNLRLRNQSRTDRTAAPAASGQVTEIPGLYPVSPMWTIPPDCLRDRISYIPDFEIVSVTSDVAVKKVEPPLIQG